MAGRRGRRYFTAERREVYLEGLRRTGNHKAAAREAGIRVECARRFRRRTPDYERLCTEAVEEAQRRLAGAEGQYEGCDGSAFEQIRRGADGRLKIQKQGRRRWSQTKEDLFFAVLRECGNISEAARIAGVSREAVWKKRRDWPAFARRFDETMEEAEIALQFRVACLGSYWAEDRPDREAEAAVDRVTVPAGTFDPELALRFLKWRRDGNGGRPSQAALPSAEEVRARIIAKVEAIKKYEAREARRREEKGE